MLRGDSRDITVTLSGADGEPIDLDLLTEIVFTAKWRYGDTADTSTTITKDLADGVTITDAPEGVCVVHLDPTDTEAFTHSHRLVWDVQVQADYDLAIRTVARGYLWVYVDVTT